MTTAKTFRLGSALVITYPCELTHSFCQSFRDYLRAIVTMQDYEHLVLDISKLKAIDESGLHLLVLLNSRIRGHGKILHLMSPPMHFLKLLQEKDLLRFFNLFRNEDDMLSNLPL